MGCALATYENVPLGMSQLEEAIKFNEEFQRDFRGAGQLENLNSYV